MSEGVLRQLLASFVIEVDKAGELAKGNAAIDALKSRLGDLQAELNKVRAPAARAGKAIQDAFQSSGWGNVPGLEAAMRQSAQNRTASLFGNFGAGSGLDRADTTPDGPVFGPTRDTLNAARAATAQADAAAAKYATTLRGRLAGAVKAVRDGFNRGGGESGGGPGLIQSLATARNGLLALAGSATVVALKRLVDGIGDIGEGAQQLGVSTDQFQRLSVLAAQNGTSVQALGTAFRNLSTAAVQPTKETEKSFRELGVSVKDGSGQFKSANDLFFDTTAALAGVTDETKRNALAQDLLGRSALELKPLFANGTAAVNEQRKALASLNVLSEDTIKQADGISDTWKTLPLLFLTAAEPLLKLLLPALAHLTEWVVKGTEALGKFLKRTDFTSIALTALGVAMVWKVIPALQVMIGLGGGVTASLLGMAGAAARATLAFLAWAIPIAVIEDFIGFLRGDESAIGEALDMLFGKGASTAVIDALGKSWDLLASSVKRVLEALHLLKPTDQDLEQRARADQAWEGSNFARKLVPALKNYGNYVLPGFGTSVSLAGKAADWLTSSTASADYGLSTMPVPNVVGQGSLMSSAEANSSPAPNVSIGDTHIEITMSDSASAGDVGRAVRSAVSSSQEQLVSTYQSY